MNFRDRRGSIAIFVLVGLLFMTSFLLLSYANSVNKSKIAKEQFNMISSIYSHNDGDANAYNRAYTQLREKNKKILTQSTQSNKTLELTRTYEQKIVNYQIYGSMNNNIVITVTKGAESKKYSIQLANPLGTDEYIDYKTKSVLYKNGTIKERITSLPDIYAYEDNTKITITSGGTPSKIVIEYVGYTIN